MLSLIFIFALYIASGFFLLRLIFLNNLVLLQNHWAFSHLVFSILALVGFMITLTLGLLYLASEYNFKKKKTSRFLDKLPPLETLEKLHYTTLYVAFLFFSAGIITGAGWSKSVTGLYISGDKKQLISFAIWVFFAVFLNIRVFRGWVGRRGVLLSMIGFLGIIILMLLLQN